MKFFKSSLAASAVAATLVVSVLPATAQANGHGNRPITVYFTRHAEKKTTTIPATTNPVSKATTTYELVYNGDVATATPSDDGPSAGENLNEVCDDSKCAEELSDLGLKRAELLAIWFKRRGITRRVDEVISSHKRRTFQTVEQIAIDAGVSVDQYPTGKSELEPSGTTESECPTLDAIRDSQPGDTIVVAGHSGTLYDIMGMSAGSGTPEDPICDGLGLDTSNADRFPVKDGKVRDFGDVWKVLVYPNGGAEFVYRVNLQPKALRVDNYSY